MEIVEGKWGYVQRWGPMAPQTTEAVKKVVAAGQEKFCTASDVQIPPMELNAPSFRSIIQDMIQ